MKQWITLATATVIFTSCTKQNLQEENLLQEKQTSGSALRVSKTGAYVSNWEQFSEWQKADEGSISMFIVKRKTPEVTSDVTNGGLVLSYAKTATSNPNYILFTSPVQMPFYFLPESERPYPYHYHFSDGSSEGLITIVYRTPLTKATLPAMGGGASLPAMQFQFVVITRAFLEANGLTAEAVRNNYTYEQVMNLVN